MPVDTSIYGQIKQPDPMAAVNNVIGMSNALTQNRILQTEGNMLQQGYQGDLAVGRAYQQSLKPDGSVDVPALNNRLATNPAAAYRAPQAFAGSTSLQGANLNNQGATVGQSQDRLGAFYQSIGPLVNGATPPTRAQVMGMASDMLHQGRLLPQDMVAINSEVPLDPKAVAAYAKTKFAGALPATVQAAPTDLGVNASGQTMKGTQGQQLDRAVTSGGYAATLPTGQADAIATANKTLQGDQQYASQRMAALRPLQNALPLLDQLSNSAFGPGSSGWSQVKAGLETAGIIQPGTSDVAVRQEANKYLLQYAKSANDAGRSDQALSTALHANPSLDLTQPANVALVKNQIAMDRMEAAMPNAYVKANPNVLNDPSQAVGYLPHKSAFFQGQDPRAYRLDLMSPQERAELQKSLGPKGSPAYEKFTKSYNAAKQAGVFGTPAQGAQ